MNLSSTDALSSTEPTASRMQSALFTLIWITGMGGAGVMFWATGVIAQIKALFTLPAVLTMPVELAVRHGRIHTTVPMHTGWALLGLLLALVSMTLVAAMARREEQNLRPVA